ncbi:TetR/AcrR family transcriptional regulator [Amycolatopsis rhabdoformis]|uniref:TetR/AcrR family transcriptional regulator n=1 Tax=Amycolatopsis rhabdoformis TaxID=1448059 RepID=A0ABZ1HY12_9PSEU|nr:TetR/AcrR family transcriptional regulator [Amycolatopsis rhabdoformis]WSE26511.1 TetR/AcrR family transcriptional regulator [Amycolatopsis rhabdoformis]
MVAHANAPRGSLQHYFPGGKEQLVGEAVEWAGRYAARRVRRGAESMEDATPGNLFAAMVQPWRAEFADRGFGSGCPIVATVADSAALSEKLRESAAAAFAEWRKPLVAELEQMGVSATRAASLAVLMISSLEGALVLARADQDVAPLDAIVEELRPLLDGAVEKRRRRTG